MSHSCSFCNRPQDEVNWLVIGHNVGICDECIEECNSKIAEMKAKAAQPNTESK